MSTWPSPPSLRAVDAHASKLYSESTDAKTTFAPRSVNCLAASEKAMISVGLEGVNYDNGGAGAKLTRRKSTPWG